MTFQASSVMVVVGVPANVALPLSAEIREWLLDPENKVMLSDEMKEFLFETYRSLITKGSK